MLVYSCLGISSSGQVRRLELESELATCLRTFVGIRSALLLLLVNLPTVGRQYCSEGNISRGASGRRGREPVGGSEGMLPQKILKSKGLEMLFPAFSNSYL